MKNKQKLFRWIKLIVAVYALAGIALYYLQEKFLFHPVAIPADSSYHFSQPFTEANILLDQDTRFNLVQFTPADTPAKRIVLYFHGNRENVNHYAGFAKNFTSKGYEVWMPDYPGFGKSTGKLTEAILYEEALHVYKLARIRYQPEQILIYGKSLGTGIAAQLASVRDCRQLILETPYYSLTSLTRLFFWMYPVNQLLHFKMRTHEYLPKVTAPVTIFHGTADGVIPYLHAKRLKKLLKPADSFITIEGGSHNDLNSFPLMQEKLDSLLRK
ncbi:MAG: alpha/beta fold hydrolase [Bacteroidetes bacterium]|nr:alpha/beta fold hydrolase [Bacteroidota bacterium]